MKLQVQSYGSGAYNAEVEETAPFHYRIDHAFNGSAECNIILQDPTGALAQKYIIDSKKAVSGAVADDGGAQTDETTEANEDTADDMTLTPADEIVINDAYYYGFPEEVGGMTLNVTQALIPAATEPAITWEYWDGDSWESLADVVDDTTYYKVAGENTVSWTIPGDWATSTENGQGPFYWIRGRWSAASDIDTQGLGGQVWYNKIWPGPGKVTIEDPDSTDLFYGRIMKAEADTTARTLTLYCQDWLSQLDETQITYDMREDLDGNGLRESVAHSDPNGAFVDVAENDGGTFYFYDDGDYDDADGWNWANDQFNGKRLVFTTGMAGKKTWRFFPYQGTDTDADVYLDNPHAVWTKETGLTDNASADNDFTLDYDFRIYLGHDTPSDFYIHSSITGARLFVRYQVGGGANNHSHIQIDDKTNGWFEFATLEEDDHFIDVVYALDTDQYSKIVDANGIATVRFDVDRAGGTAAIAVSFLYIEVDVETTGYSLAVTINDTIATNKLKVATDLTAAATRIWEGIPYCIAKEIYLHIESATGPILGGDTMVTLTCADGNVEDTSGISTRQYVGKTRLFIAQDLAVQDKAQFWITLGGVIVTWKSTFNDGAPETLTDGDVNSWASTFDYSTLMNKATVYGMRIGANRLSSTYTDTTSEATYNQTRTRIANDTGLVSEQDTLARATALVNQYKDVQQILTATIAGNTATAGHDKTLVLGDEVSITSPYLGLSSAVYIVQRFNYDSTFHLTRLLLHPRVSQIGLQRDEAGSFEKVIQDNRRGTADGYVAPPETNEVA